MAQEFSQHIEQRLAQSQVQQLSITQVALAHMVELPELEFEERVRSELETNEALEERDSDNLPADDTDAAPDDSVADEYDEPASPQDDALADYASIDDVPEYLLRQQNAREQREVQWGSATSTLDLLYSQMGEQRLSEQERQILAYLIGSLDADGYLRKDLYALQDEMEVYHNIEAPMDMVERMLALLQTFEPRGIGARDLQECLRLQLLDPELHSPWRDKALELVDNCFRDFSLRHHDVVQRRLKLSDEDYEQVEQLVTHLNPRPAGSLNDASADNAPAIVPDFFVNTDAEGNISISLNQGDVPELRVSRSYRDLLKEYGGRGKTLSASQQDAYVYARKKVTDAQFFIELVRRRRQTLLGVMEAIAFIQHDFFADDDDENALIPMVLKDVAQRAGVDVSTVSRVVSNKYCETPYGIYPLKHFFSKVFTSENGEELSSRKAKSLLRQLIDAEDKRVPLSDEALAAAMARQGMPISRRTVAKYREQMGVPKSTLRKQ